MYLLSIIIPAFNSEKFIGILLNELITQNLDNIEIIVINDGSTDKTAEVVNAFKRLNDNINLITINNSGVSVARNVGIKNAKGKYIYFLDSDDTLAENTLDFFRNILNEDVVFQIFFFGYEVLYGKKIKRYINKSYDKICMQNIKVLKKILSKYFHIHICSSIYEKKFLIENALFFTSGMKIGEDIEFIFKAVLLSQNIYSVPRICFLYQIRKDSVSEGYLRYSLNKINSFLNKLEITQKILILYPSLEKEVNFYQANIYLSNLIYYLRTKKFKDQNINNIFVKKKNLLTQKISGKKFNTFLIVIFRFIPIKFLLFFKK